MHSGSNPPSRGVDRNLDAVKDISDAVDIAAGF